MYFIQEGRKRLFQENISLCTVPTYKNGFRRIPQCIGTSHCILLIFTNETLVHIYVGMYTQTHTQKATLT